MRINPRWVVAEYASRYEVGAGFIFWQRPPSQVERQKHYLRMNIKRKYPSLEAQWKATFTDDIPFMDPGHKLNEREWEAWTRQVLAHERKYVAAVAWQAIKIIEDELPFRDKGSIEEAIKLLRELR